MKRKRSGWEPAPFFVRERWKGSPWSDWFRGELVAVAVACGDEAEEDGDDGGDGGVEHEAAAGDGFVAVAAAEGSGDEDDEEVADGDGELPVACDGGFHGLGGLSEGEFEACGADEDLGHGDDEVGEELPEDAEGFAGFKSRFKGEVVDEVFVPLTQLDFSAELAKIAAAKPDALFTFMPGGLGVNLVRQYRQAGLASIPFLCQAHSQRVPVTPPLYL